MSALVEVQGKPYSSNFVREDGKLFDKQGNVTRYWHIVPVRTNEQGGLERLKSTYSAEGGLIAEETILYPDISSSYMIIRKHYGPDGRLFVWDTWDYYADTRIEAKAEWVGEDSFKTTYLHKGPRLESRDWPLLSEAWYRYDLSGKLLEGEALNPDSKKMEPVTQAPAEDRMREQWLSVGKAPGT